MTSLVKYETLKKAEPLKMQGKKNNIQKLLINVLPYIWVPQYPLCH